MKPELKEGEVYIGCYSVDGVTIIHVILLPGDNERAAWKTQMKWAKSIGGDLPNRIEQSMLWANHRDQFKKDWYWSNEIHHAAPGWAWSQLFTSGSQNDNHTSNEFPARAVRRVVCDLV